MPVQAGLAGSTSGVPGGSTCTDPGVEDPGADDTGANEAGVAAIGPGGGVAAVPGPCPAVRSRPGSTTGVAAARSRAGLADPGPPAGPVGPSSSESSDDGGCTTRLADAHPDLTTTMAADAVLGQEIVGHGYRVVYKDLINTCFVRDDLWVEAYR